MLREPTTQTLNVVVVFTIVELERGGIRSQEPYAGVGEDCTCRILYTLDELGAHRFASRRVTWATGLSREKLPLDVRCT
jgi:hypothetical protein